MASAAKPAIADGASTEVPLHLRNASFAGARGLGYGRGYVYPHDHPGHWAPQQYLPDEVATEQFYRPGGFGFEKRIAERMAWWAERAARAGEGQGSADTEAG